MDFIDINKEIPKNGSSVEFMIQGCKSYSGIYKDNIFSKDDYEIVYGKNTMLCDCEIPEPDTVKKIARSFPINEVFLWKYI